MIRFALAISLVTTSSVAQTPIAYGDTLKGSIPTSRAVTQYNLSASRGEKIYLTVTRVRGSTFEPCLGIFDSTGTTKLVSSENYAEFNRIVYEFASTATFRIKVWDHAGAGYQTGSYYINAHRFHPSPSPGSRELAFPSTTLRGSLPTVGVVNCYWFHARPGASIRLAIARQSHNYLEPGMILFGPDGTEAARAVAYAASNVISTTTAMAGRYTLLTMDHNTAPGYGTYDVTLSCQSTASCATRAKIVSYGVGCAGSQGVPALRAPSLPVIGTKFHTMLSNLSTSRFSQAVLFMGVTRSSVPLDAIGMVGCSQLTTPLFEPPSTVQNGRAEWVFVIPLLSGLVGAKVNLQGFATDAPANSLGVTNSNGIELVIG